jgi:hypothetical protein
MSKKVQLPRIIPSWLNLKVVLQYAVVIAAFGAGFVLCIDAAPGLGGERLITWGPPNQRIPLFGLLAMLATMVALYWSQLLAGALDSKSLLDREGRLICGIGGAAGDLR